MCKYFHRYLRFEIVWDLKGKESEAKFCSQFYLIDSEKLDYVALGTCYITEKALFVAEK